MKKTTLMTIPALCLILSQTALADTPSVVSADPAEIVTLGEYKGLELTKTIQPVEDADIDAYIEQALANAPEDAGDGPVESGDIATIDFEGKKDGEAFEGGTSEGYPLEIGSGSFIPGFEDGVIGMMKGETKDIPLTFPEDYQSEELAGQDVVFTVTVQSISRKADQISEDWVKNNTDAASVDEYKEQVKAQLEEQASADADADLRQQAYDLVFQNATFAEIPEEDIQFGSDYYKQYLESMAGYFGMTLDDMIEAQGYTQEDFETMCHDYGEDQAKVFYIFEAILAQEGIEITDEEAEELLKDYLENYGVDDLAALKEAVGEDNINRAILTEKVIKFILENANITEETAAPAEETAEAAEAADENAGEAAEETEETEAASEETEEEAPAEEAAEEAAEEPAAEPVSETAEEPAE